MSEEKLIVDNTRELHKLYSKGLFYIPEEFSNVQTDVNAQTQSREVETSSESKIEIKEVVLGTKKVLNLVFEDTDFDYASVIANSMKALGFENDFDVLSYNILRDLTSKEARITCQNEFLVFWGNQSINKKAADLTELEVKRLTVDMPSVLVSSKENKQKNWLALKTFFGQ